MKLQYIKNLRKLLPTLVLWLLTEVSINSRSQRVWGSTLPVGRECGSSMPLIFSCKMCVL